MNVYPTNEFHDSVTTSLPVLYTVLVILILIGLGLWFAICQYLRERDNHSGDPNKNSLKGVDWTLASKNNASKEGTRGSNKELLNAFLSDQKHTSLDPSGELSIDDLEQGQDHSADLGDDSHQSNRSRNIDHSHRSQNPNNNNSLLPLSIRNSKPIADLFPSASVSMADISGFTGKYFPLVFFFFFFPFY